MTKQQSGLLYCQVGTPNEPTAKAVRAYLKQFLSDPNIVPADTFWWPLVLNAFILPFRPRKVAKKYKLIWREDGSPLRIYTGLQSKALQAGLGDGIPFAAGNCYGEPNIKEAVAGLLNAGVTRIVVLSAYPHPSRATSGAFVAAVKKAAAGLGAKVEIALWPEYYREQAWLGSLSRRINETLGACGRVDYLLCSYHGVPLQSVADDDSYPRSCEATTDALKPLVHLPADRILHCYQSRFGFARWTEPYTDQVITDLAKAGAKRLVVACPGFNCDCLETLYDVGVVFRDFFRKRGGETLELVPGLNDQVDWLMPIAQKIRQAL